MPNPNEINLELAELRKISSLLTVIAIDGKSQNEKILIYSQLDMTHQQIGDAVGITKNAVTKSLARLQNKRVGNEE